MAKKRGSSALILLGVFLVIGGGVALAGYRQMATVIYPQFFWYSLYPGGASAQPTMITAGNTITLSIKLVYYDATAYVELPAPSYWDVSVTIVGGGKDYFIDFGLRTGTQGGVKVDSHFCAIAIWDKPWTVPAGDGVQYILGWRVVIKDSNGVTIGTKTTTTYAKTSDVEPDGIFKINGEVASETAQLIVLDGKLELVFTATKGGDLINQVYVTVAKAGEAIGGDVELTGSNPTWRTSYTLPEVGTYELHGFFRWGTQNNIIRKMNLVTSWGEETAPPGLPTLSKAEMMGLASAFLGLVFIAVGIAMRR